MASRHRLLSQRQLGDERLLGLISQVHRENYECYGYPRVWHELRRQGVQVGRDRVARLMRSAGIHGAKRRGRPPRTTKPDPQALRGQELLERRFIARRPNELWLADLTHLRCWEGLLYLAFIVDLYSRMVVGWQLASHLRTDMVLDALRMAIGIRGPGASVGLTHHSEHHCNPDPCLVLAARLRASVARAWRADHESGLLTGGFSRAQMHNI